MATHIVLINFTDQGIRNIKDSPARAAALTQTANQLGVQIEGLYWTSGKHDGVLVMNAPDAESAAAVTLILGRSGNVHTQTLNAFDQGTMENILGRI